MITSVQLGKLRVEWLEETMKSLRDAVMERFGAAAPVGEELAGILYGLRSTSSIQITAWRAIPRDRPGVAALPLTEEETNSARALLSDYMADVDLIDLVPIGWFRSRTRGMAALSPEDAQVCELLFGTQESLAVILRPSTQRPVIASFFAVRQGMELEASLRGTQVALEDKRADAQGGIDNEEETFAVVAPPIVQENAVRLKPRAGLGARWMLPVAAFLGGVLLSTLASFMLLDRPVRLRAGVQGLTLAIQWNKSVGFLSRARGASLEIAGQPAELSLDQLRAGVLRTTSPAGDFQVRLRVHGPFADSQRAVITIVESPIRQGE